MENHERKNRIREALEMRGMKQIELAEKSGIRRGTISNWLNNKYQPKQPALAVMARILDVSELWLAGYDIPMERAPEQKQADALVELFNQLRSDAEFKELVFKIRSDAEFKELAFKLSKLSPEKYQTISNLVNQLAD